VEPGTRIPYHGPPLGRCGAIAGVAFRAGRYGWCQPAIFLALHKPLNRLAIGINSRDTQETMPRPIRRCRRCRHALPPWSRLDARYRGDTCRQQAHREWRRSRRSPVCEAGPVVVRDQQAQITDLEALMASLDATSERVMANVARIVKRSAD
jgi:hypothetical protein